VYILSVLNKTSFTDLIIKILKECFFIKFIICVFFILYKYDSAKFFHRGIFLTKKKRKRGRGLGIGGKIGNYTIAAGIVWRKKKKKRK